MTDGTARPRKPWVAVVLSLLATGLGHLYAGQPRLALLRYATAAAVGLVAIVLVLNVPMGMLAIVVGFGVWIWIAVDAGRHARNAPRDFVLRRYNRWYVYIALMIVSGLLSEIPKQFFEAFRIPSGAMEPALMVGDWIFVRKGPLRDPPAVGRIIVFRSREAEYAGVAFVKRVVGMPGDTVRMERGALYRNGVRPAEVIGAPSGDEEGYTDPLMRWQRRYVVGVDTTQYMPTSRTWGPIVVPRDSFFVMGDNRDMSRDSRWYGLVGAGQIFASPHSVYYSYDGESDKPASFLTAIRWERLGHRIR